MNFIAICLHCLDMRDFHSNLRTTPFLDKLRERSIFIPMGRGQGHHHGDSLNAELTGIWAARFTDSVLDKNGYRFSQKAGLPKTVIEYLAESGYDIFTCLTANSVHQIGTWAVQGGMQEIWLKNEPERLKQFSLPKKMFLNEWLDGINNSKRFYAHIFLRHTHRPWAQTKKLYSLLGLQPSAQAWVREKRGLPLHWPHDAYVTRRAALENPDGFAALRRGGLAMADKIVEQIFAATSNLKNVTYIVYSNHGEVYDHFRYNQAYSTKIVEGLEMVGGTSHGNFPYEVLYANMQMWLIPNLRPKIMGGIGRSIDFSPTVLDLADIRPEHMDGESMLKHFAEGAFLNRDRYAETPTGGGCLSMVRNDGFKLIANGADNPVFADHKLAVFDLRSDPYEYVNLINTDLGRDVLDWAITRHHELSGTLLKNQGTNSKSGVYSPLFSHQ